MCGINALRPSVLLTKFKSVLYIEGLGRFALQKMIADFIYYRSNNKRLHPRGNISEKGEKEPQEIILAAQFPYVICGKKCLDKIIISNY